MPSTTQNPPPQLQPKKQQPTPHSAADAERAMSSTAAWKPSPNRRQSWDKEELKHDLQMSRVGNVGAGQPGFTEKG
ncbi:hypothetical protein QBC33DRAFT_558316 [Phialemonium atrogriseum]|uniref:Uncharacterized protein n=1 Tax=Phialemonium atrogriseum TaxID=1093897 RepID=A0AAJ0C1F5_9PEZI|nr:uncharacterized protein QBC33DRAFT_558316 [Phialemonium atrogriseum]KAK1768151.1 hypothetical protein QBC33DRAFT_558316 [Phialemonium atrogriseum]